MRDKAIGVFDSGLGGLAVARKAMDEMPEEDIVYFADFAHLPYGPRAVEEVRRYVLDIVEFFIEEDVKAILIGCNTASVAGGRQAQEKLPYIPVIGMIEPAVRATLDRSDTRRVGVIGTQTTINSRAYERAFGERTSVVDVVGHICPELLRRAEQGDVDDKDEIQRAARNCIMPLEIAGIDTLVLGCTDLTCITDELRMALHHDIRMIDPAEEVAITTAAMLEERKWRRTGEEKGSIRFFASGKAPKGAEEFAQRVFGIPINGFQIV